MEYKAEFDTRHDVLKKNVSQGKTLYFIPDENEKYQFCSNDPTLQKWCESVKKKKVKKNNVNLVVAGAKSYLSGKTALRTPGNSVVANWKDNPVGTLQNILQAQGKLPKYSNPLETFSGRIAVTLTVEGYKDILKTAQNQNEARRACAIEFAQTYLGIDVEKEIQKVADNADSKPTPPVATKTTKLPQTFSVDADKCGNWNQDAISALQTFCQKNKIELPQYFDRGTTQGSVTQSSMMMKLGEYTTTQTAPTKKEAKQKCAQAFYNDVLTASQATKQEIKTRDNPLQNFPVPNMSEYFEDDRLAWAGVLNQLSARAHLPNPEFVSAAIVVNNEERKCPLPRKINLKSGREGETRVMYMKMAGIDGKIRGEGRQFADAKHNAAKNCLCLIWYDHMIYENQKEGNDKMVEFYTSQKQKLAKKCLVGTPKPISKQQPKITPSNDQGLDR